MAPLQQSQPTLSRDPFVKCLHDVARKVEDLLDQILPLPTTRLHEAMRFSVLGGGKRLRSFLTYASSQMFDVPAQKALRVGAAIELIHAYSLVHDDLPCMDNAAIRRGKPSCHKAFGEATAILVGDALIPLAFQILSSLEGSPEIRLLLIEKLAETIGSLGLVGGQMMDLGQEGSRHTLKDLLEQQRLKTGVLFGFSAEAGAILGRGASFERESLRSYGLFFGQAFQMMDDWLDVCGEENTTGKPCGQDEKKFTFITFLDPALLYERAEASLQDAIKVLSPFHEKADFLKKMALYTLDRKG